MIHQWAQVVPAVHCRGKSPNALNWSTFSGALRAEGMSPFCTNAFVLARHDQKTRVLVRLRVLVQSFKERHQTAFPKSLHWNARCCREDGEFVTGYGNVGVSFPERGETQRIHQLDGPHSIGDGKAYSVMTEDFIGLWRRVNG